MNSNCTVYKTLDFLGRKWSIFILLELYKGKGGCRRYNDLKRALPGITPKILSMRLRELEKEGLVRKKVDNNGKLKSMYYLNKSGIEFMKVVTNIKKWALEHKFKSKHCEMTKCKDCEF